MSNEYYILKCPFCDDDITSVMESPDAKVTCPKCNKELNLYTVFGYNMWLVENNKITKVSKRPIKDIKIKNKNYGNIKTEEWEDGNSRHIKFIVSSDEDVDDYKETDNFEESDGEPKTYEDLLLFNAAICHKQYDFLVQAGFKEKDALDMVKKLIDQGFIL